MTAPGVDALLVGDPVRPTLGRAVWLGMAAGSGFVALSLIEKNVPWLATAAPWAQDPYDAFVSFGIPLVVGLLGLAGARVLLCRAAEPLPAARVVGVLRAITVLLVVAVGVLLAEWGSVVSLGVRTGPAASVEVGLLFVESALVFVALVALADIRARARVGGSSTDRPDSVDDLLTIAELVSHAVGGVWPAGGRSLARASTVAAGATRRHPIAVAGLIAIEFGALAAGSAALEGDPVTLVLVVASVASAGAFTFVLVIGRYLGFVAPEPTKTRRRTFRLLSATAASAASVPIALAFRDQLWPLFGINPETAGLDDLVRLLAGVALLTLACASLATVRTKW